jgi:hypothetical protein
MAHVRDDEKNALDCIDDIYQLGCLFAAVFRDSDYRFGDLHYAEPMGEGCFPDYIAEPPESMKSGWTYFHEIPMVLHPEKGALLLRTVWAGDDEPPETLTERIESDHSELTALEWKIRDRLESVGYWKNRPIVLGVGVVTSSLVPDDLRPANVPAVAVIDRSALPCFASHIDALFEHYKTPAAEPIDEWGARLVTDITDSPELLGGFVGEDNLIDGYEDWGCELDGLVEPAA